MATPILGFFNRRENSNASFLMSASSPTSPSSPPEPRPIAGSPMFSPEEDRHLNALVKEIGVDDWDRVAAQMPNHTRRQCRERYVHFLGPPESSEPWTPDEDALLVHKVETFGEQWARISRAFPGRSMASVKNRWCVLARTAPQSAVMSPIMAWTRLMTPSFAPRTMKRPVAPPVRPPPPAARSLSIPPADPTARSAAERIRDIGNIGAVLFRALAGTTDDVPVATQEDKSA
jgi:hypothetical protein